MDGNDAASAPIYRPSAEITPDEYDYYMRKAQEMRAEATARIFRRIGAAMRGLFSRSKPAPRHAPALAKSRTA